MFIIPSKLTEKRLTEWKQLRNQLETSASPFEDVVAFFDRLPKTKIYTDPYDQDTWPTAWEMIEENQYCRFNIILGIFYTLRLCNRFEKSNLCISISIDNNNNSVYYLLYVDNIVYGYNENKWIAANTLPMSLKNIKIYPSNTIH